VTRPVRNLGVTISDVVGLVHESIHSTKAKNKSGMFLKIDLKKAYDRVNCTFLRLVLIQIGLKQNVVQWIMGCVSSVSFSILINGSPSKFFKATRGLQQGCPLFPLLFLLVVECSRRMILKAKSEGNFTGFKVYVGNMVTHLLFVDDIIILCSGSVEEWIYLNLLLDSFYRASSLDINVKKSCFIYRNVEEKVLQEIIEVFGVSSSYLDDGFKYLGYFLKPNSYKVADWLWLVKKFEKRITLWAYRSLSMGGRLVLIKVVLHNILVY